MSEKQVITLVVDGIRLPLKVSREKEEYFRQAAKRINSKLSEYRGKYSQVDSSALLALTAVQCMAEWLETEDRDEVGRLLEEMEAVSARVAAVEQGLEGETDEESAPLREQLIRHYTPLQAFCIMLFCLLSIPCLATLAVMRRELNSWKLTVAEAAGMFLLAYIVTFLVYQAGSLCGIGTALGG